MLLVVSRPLGDEEMHTVRAILLKEIGTEFKYDLTFCETISRTAEGKPRPFISQVTPRDGPVTP